MSIPYIQSTISQARCVDGCYISYPFIESGDTATKVYNMTCIQLAEDYSASQLDLDDPMTNANTAGVIELPDGWGDPVAYFVGDTNHTSISGGLLSFTRTFSNIPTSITIPSGSAMVTFPGVGAGGLGEIQSVSNSTTTDEEGLRIVTEAAHGAKVGEDIRVVSLYAKGSYPSQSNVYISSYGNTLTGDYEVLEVISDTEVRINYGTGWAFDYNWTLYGGAAKRASFPDYDIIAVSMTSGDRGVTVTTNIDNGVTAGVTVHLRLGYTVGDDPFIHTVQGRYTALDSASSATFRVDIGRYWNEQVTLNLVSGAVKILEFERSPVVINSNTQTRYEYILPGVTPGVASTLDVIIPPTFSVIGSDGASRDTVEDYSVAVFGTNYTITRTTYPSRIDYIIMLQNGENIITESSLSVWAGNILVQKTTTVKAK